MADKFIPSFGDLDKLSNGDRANDTLETCRGWARWDGDSEAAMLFTISDAQGAKQGFMYGLTLGFAALHNRIHYMYVYGTDQKLRESFGALTQAARPNDNCHTVLGSPRAKLHREGRKNQERC